MGASHYAYVLLGVRLSREQVFETLPGCCADADRYDHGMKFCPNTGNKARRPGQKLLLSDGELAEDCDVESQEALDGLSLIADRSGWGEDATIYYLGACVIGSAGEGEDAYHVTAFRPAPTNVEVAEVRERCKRILEPRGLWDVAGFGLHVFAMTSC